MYDADIARRETAAAKVHKHACLTNLAVGYGGNLALIITLSPKQQTNQVSLMAGERVLALHLFTIPCAGSSS